jgi:L-seryl-tRNA(Ser) seleniumtransferase
MRPDKATLAGVAATLGLYRAGLATTRIPVWRMIATAADALQARADTLAARIPGAAVVTLTATIGGGSLAGETLPSFGIAVAARSADRLAAALRMGEPAVLARIEGGRVVLDLRTVDPSADDELAGAVARALAGSGGAG